MSAERSVVDHQNSQPLCLCRRKVRIYKPSSLVNYFTYTLHTSYFSQKRLPYVLMSSFWLQKSRGKKTYALFLPPLYSTHSIRNSRWSLGVFVKVPNCMRHEKRSREVQITQVKTPTRDWHERCWLDLFYKMAPGYYMTVAFCMLRI
jgi:hypothetical protein